MAFWRTYYHLIWATQNRQPLIRPEQEQDLYGYIRGKADSLGCIVHAIGGMADHIHVVVSIPPKLSVAEFVKRIKGGSSHYINHLSEGPEIPLKWQEGYGVFSLGGQQLERAKAYVNRQKEHHTQGTILIALEQEA